MHRLGGLFNKNTSASSLTAVPGGASGGGSTSGGGGGSANKLNVNVQRKLSRGVDHNLKVVVRGDAGVGKTCLFKRLQGENFVADHVETAEINVANIAWSYKVTDDVIKVEIWDVVDKGKPKPNQPKDMPLLDAANVDVYKSTHAVVFVYDIRKKWTFDYIVRELPNVPAHISVLVLGNFADCEAERQVHSADVEVLLNENQGRAGQTHSAGSSMKDGFGLKFLYKYLNVPFLIQQRDLLQRQIDDNAREIAATMIEVDYAKVTPDQDYNKFLEALAAAKNKKPVTAVNPTESAMTSPATPSQPASSGPASPSAPPATAVAAPVPSVATTAAVATAVAAAPAKKEKKKESVPKPAAPAPVPVKLPQATKGDVKNVDDFVPPADDGFDSFLDTDAPAKSAAANKESESGSGATSFFRRLIGNDDKAKKQAAAAQQQQEEQKKKADAARQTVEDEDEDDGNPMVAADEDLDGDSDEEPVKPVAKAVVTKSTAKQPSPPAAKKQIKKVESSEEDDDEPVPAPAKKSTPKAAAAATPIKKQVAVSDSDDEEDDNNNPLVAKSDDDDDDVKPVKKASPPPAAKSKAPAAVPAKPKSSPVAGAQVVPKAAPMQPKKAAPVVVSDDDEDSPNPLVAGDNSDEEPAPPPVKKVAAKTAKPVETKPKPAEPKASPPVIQQEVPKKASLPKAAPVVAKAAVKAVAAPQDDDDEDGGNALVARDDDVSDDDDIPPPTKQVKAAPKSPVPKAAVKAAAPKAAVAKTEPPKSADVATAPKLPLSAMSTKSQSVPSTPVAAPPKPSLDDIDSFFSTPTTDPVVVEGSANEDESLADEPEPKSNSLVVQDEDEDDAVPPVTAKVETSPVAAPASSIEHENSAAIEPDIDDFFNSEPQGSVVPAAVESALPDDDLEHDQSENLLVAADPEEDDNVLPASKLQAVRADVFDSAPTAEADVFNSDPTVYDSNPRVAPGQGVDDFLDSDSHASEKPVAAADPEEDNDFYNPEPKTPVVAAVPELEEVIEESQAPVQDWAMGSLDALESFGSRSAPAAPVYNSSSSNNNNNLLDEFDLLSQPVKPATPPAKAASIADLEALFGSPEPELVQEVEPEPKKKKAGGKKKAGDKNKKKKKAAVASDDDDDD